MTYPGTPQERALQSALRDAATQAWLNQARLDGIKRDLETKSILEVKKNNRERYE